MEGVAGAATATATVEDAAPCARRAFLDEDGWRSIAATRGYGHLALAEVVTSMPGGSEQRWHFDGEGVTAQIALVPIGDAQGPTEVTPRPMASEFVDNSEFVSGISAAYKMAVDARSKRLGLRARCKGCQSSRSPRRSGRSTMS